MSTHNLQRNLLIGFALAAMVLVAIIGVHALTRPAKGAATKKTVTKVAAMPTAAQKASPTTDIWTGNGGSNFKWSNAANWSKGLPRPNEDLIFVAGSQHLLQSINDIEGMSVNSITFEGGNSSTSSKMPQVIDLSGNPINLAHGIVDQTLLSVNSSIAFGVNLTRDQTLNLNANFSFAPTGLGEADTTNCDIGDNTLTVTGDSGITFNELSGSGTIISAPTTKTPGIVGVYQNSPQFSGAVEVKAGLFAINYGKSFGSASIHVHNGATLRIQDTTSDVASLSNNITLAGNGFTTNGQHFGAMNVVGLHQDKVKLTGTVTLTGNATVGAVNAQHTASPNTGTATFTFTRPPILNGYTLKSLASKTKLVYPPS